jgi:hypothetical protein
VIVVIALAALLVLALTVLGCTVDRALHAANISDPAHRRPGSDHGAPSATPSAGAPPIAANDPPPVASAEGR